MRVIVGDLWAQPGAKVIPTNLRGVMGRGLAAQAKARYPGIQEWYQQQLRETAGVNPYARLSSWGDLILFPVKDHWSDEVDLELVKAGLQILRDRYETLDPVNVPALGCGFGEGDPLVLLPTIVQGLDDRFTLVLASPEVGQRYSGSFKPGARTDRRWVA